MKGNIISLSTDRIPSSYRFVKVIGEDGAFYDLSPLREVKKHIARLTNKGYSASVVKRNSVPPCIFRDFSCSLGTYSECRLNNGTNFYFN